MTLKTAKRPEDWGQREKHPLYSLWTWHKSRNRYGMVLEWAGDFWAFVSAVGDRPSDNHRLRRYEINQPIGPENFFWDEKYASGDTSPKNRAARAAYMREYRKRRPRNVRDTMLKRTYGITLAQWEGMYADQNGVCAICHTCEAEKSARYANMCVDHCHDTGKVRGLLCNSCNRALGLMQDNIDSVARMVDYLRQAKEKT